MRALKISLIITAAALILLITGASPILGVPAIYKSGIFILIGLALASLSLWASACIRKRNWGLFCLHLGIFLLITGGIIDWAKEKKFTFSIFIGEEYASELVYDDTSQLTHPLGFEFTVLDFRKEYYPQKYALYLRTLEGIKQQEEGIRTTKEIRFPQHNITLPLTTLEGEHAPMPPHHIIGEKQIILPTRPIEKYFGAQFRIKPPTGDEIRQELAVNSPISFNGWKFYLISHGNDTQQRPYVRLIAKNAPGTFLVHLGIYLLILGSLLFAFLPQKHLPQKTSLS